ncbi:MAG: elongation factor P--(R)-beta-lysine ligase [Spirochaetales bacterium]|nr:elongation factor P--(R)-beta-lysine ligase [Spirochaetales bacterium]
MNYNREIFIKRAAFIREIRFFFNSRNYLEVETPVLTPYLIPESAIEVFRTERRDPYGTEQDLFLCPSPELWMKRLIGMGFGDIFQISKCFRNSESIGKIHNPEFTMLEWYTNNADYVDSMSVMEHLLDHLKKRLNLPGSAGLSGALERLSMREAFSRYLKTDLDKLEDKGELVRFAGEIGVSTDPEESWEAIFNKIFLTYIERELPKDRPVILFDYPKKIRTLARENEDSLYCERWELYISGLEIANCFTEERDYSKIRKFFESESVEKAASLVPHKIDPDFPELFIEDYPPCSGVALGVDRLFMAFYGLRSINQVILFSFPDIMS